MISSTELNKLLESRRFVEADKMLQKHYSGPDEFDVVSSRKITNLVRQQYLIFEFKTYLVSFIVKVAVIMCGDTKFTPQETEILVKWFKKACQVIHQSDVVDDETVKKVIGFCLHVTKRLTTDETMESANYLLALADVIISNVNKHMSKFDTQDWSRIQFIVHKLVSVGVKEMVLAHKFSEAAQQLAQRLPANEANKELVKWTRIPTLLASLENDPNESYVEEAIQLILNSDKVAEKKEAMSKLSKLSVNNLAFLNIIANAYRAQPELAKDKISQFVWFNRIKCKLHWGQEEYHDVLDVAFEIFQYASKPEDQEFAVNFFNKGALQFVSQEEYETGFNLCSKMRKMEDTFQALLHFWKALFKFFAVRQKLLQRKDSNDDTSEATAYTKILTPQVYANIQQDFKSCHDILKKSPQDVLKNLFKDTFITIQQIIGCFLDTSVADFSERDTECQQLIKLTWKLLEYENWEQVQENVQAVLQWPNIDDRNIDSLLIKAEVKLIQSQYLLSISSPSESPLECLETASRCIRVKVSHSDLKTVLCNLNIARLRYKIMETYLKISISVGLPLQTKFASKELLAAALAISTFPSLTSTLLKCIETHLQFEDHQEAQVKLREIEHLIQHVPTKTKSKLINAKTGIDDDICASPVMPKVTYDLKSCLKNSNASSVLSKQEMIMYFTYQGVVWSLEGSQEQATKYFKQVLNCIEFQSQGESSHFKALRWIFEHYAQSQEFDQARRVLHLLKRHLDNRNSEVYFKEAAISLALAQKTRQDLLPPSPPPMKPLRQEDLRTPAPTFRVPKSNALKPKTIKPLDYDLNSKVSKVILEEYNEESDKDQSDGITRKMDSLTVDAPKSKRRGVRRGAKKEEDQEVGQIPRSTRSTTKPKKIR